VELWLPILSVTSESCLQHQHGSMALVT